MTSSAKIEANRRNARRSTGPRRPSSKARVARNAYKHGLSVPVRADQSHAEIADYIEALRSEFGPGHDLELILRAAEGQAELLRTRRCKVDMLNRDAARIEEDFVPVEERVAAAFVQKLELIKAFDRYERRAIAKRRRAMRKLSAPPGFGRGREDV